MTDLNKIRKATGFVNVTFLKENGNKEKGVKEVMHNSTALALASTGIVKIDSQVKEYKPKKVKE